MFAGSWLNYDATHCGTTGCFTNVRTHVGLGCILRETFFSLFASLPGFVGSHFCYLLFCYADKNLDFIALIIQNLVRNVGIINISDAINMHYNACSLVGVVH